MVPWVTGVPGAVPQDRKIAHCPFHTLMPAEREVFLARKKLLDYMGFQLRRAVLAKESQWDLKALYLSKRGGWPRAGRPGSAILGVPIAAPTSPSARAAQDTEQDRPPHGGAAESGAMLPEALGSVGHSERTQERPLLAAAGPGFLRPCVLPSKVVV